MKNYEVLTIIKPNLDTEEVDKVLSNLTSVVSEMGGKIESTDKIGRKKLAYDIKKFRDGFYCNIILSLPENKVAEFRRALKLNDNVLRTMILEQEKSAV